LHSPPEFAPGVRHQKQRDQTPRKLPYPRPSTSLWSDGYCSSTRDLTSSQTIKQAAVPLLDQIPQIDLRHKATGSRIGAVDGMTRTPNVRRYACGVVFSIRVKW